MRQGAVFSCGVRQRAPLKGARGLTLSFIIWYLKLNLDVELVHSTLVVKCMRMILCDYPHMYLSYNARMVDVCEYGIERQLCE